MKVPRKWARKRGRQARREMPKAMALQVRKAKEMEARKGRRAP